MKKLLFLAYIFILFVSTISYGEELFGKCIGVADGDTCTILVNGKDRVRIRFYGIDAPESDQEFGKESKDYCTNLVFGKDLRVTALYKDKYGRTVGKVYQGNTYINLEMVKAGLAWHYVYYSKNDFDFANAEKEARAKKLGLWIQPNPLEPREYRKVTKNKMTPVYKKKLH